MEPQDLEAKIAALSTRVDELSNSINQRLSAIEHKLETKASSLQPTTDPSSATATKPAESIVLPNTQPTATPPANLDPVPLGQQPVQTTQQPPPPQLPADLTSQYPELVKPKQSASAVQFNTETLLRWVGVGLVTLAAIFLVSTAIARNWISEEVQLALAGLLGGVMLFSTVALVTKRKPWAAWIGSAGAIVLIAASISTYSWLELVRPNPAVGIGLASAGIAIVVALATRVEAIAATTFTVTLWILSFGLADSPQRLTLTSVVLLGLLVTSLIVATAQAWEWTWITSTVVHVLALTVLAAAESQDITLSTGIIILGIASLALWFSALLFPNSAKKDAGEGLAAQPANFEILRARIVGLLPIWAGFTFIIPTGSPRTEVVFLVITLIAAAFGIAAIAIDKLLIGLSTIFGALSTLAIGLLFLFEGINVVVPLLLHAAAAATFGYYFKDLFNKALAMITAAAATLVGLGVIIANIEDGFGGLGQWVAGTATLFAWAGLAAAATVFKDRLPASTNNYPIVGAWLILLAWVVTAVAGFNGQLALVTVIWGILAVTAIVVGLTQNWETIRYLGIGTLLLTVAKMLLVDLQGVDVFVRVIIFFVFGVALIAVGLAVPKLVKGDN